MRDPKRIEQFTRILANHWKGDVPDWRFGQLMSNFLGYVTSKTRLDIFSIEDDEMARLLDEFFTPSEVQE